MIRLVGVTPVLVLTLATARVALGGGTIGDDDQGSGSNPGGPDASCPAVSFTATQVIPSIQLLIDRSGSMRELLPNCATRQPISVIPLPASIHPQNGTFRFGPDTVLVATGPAADPAHV